MTVSEFKKIVASWPEVDADGRATQVWMECGASTTTPLGVVRSLGSERPSEMVFGPENQIIWTHRNIR